MDTRPLWERYAAYLVLLIPILYLLWLHILGANAFYTIHDNMDSEICFRLVLKHAGMLFTSSNAAIVPNVMQDLPRNAFNASSYNVITFLFAWLSPLAAYQANEIIIRTLALMGAYLLCMRLVFPQEFPGRMLASALLAAFFSLTQAYMLYGISVLGFPLLLVAWHNAMSQSKARNIAWASLATVVYAFYSSLVLFGFAVILMAGGYALYLWFHRKRVAAWVLASQVTLLGLLYLVSEQNLFKLFLAGKGFISHRTAFDVYSTSFCKPTGTLPGIFFKTLLFGHYHSPYLAMVPILLGVIVVVIAWRKRELVMTRPMIFAIGVGVLLTLIHAVNLSTGFAYVKEHVSILRMFMFERFFFMYPVVWTVALGLTIYTLVRLVKRPWWLLAPMLAIHVIAGTMCNTELRANVTQLVACGKWPAQQIYTPVLITKVPALARLFESKPVATWNQFHAPALFAKMDMEHPEIKAHGWVACLGFFPSIAQFNGYRTLDSYQNNFALSYKERFRKIIAPELALSPQYLDYYNGFGSRCYLVSHEISAQGYYEKPLKGYYLTDPKLTIKDLRISTQAFQELGGTHILSSLVIENAKQIGLDLIAKYQDPSTSLQLYVYQVASRP